MDDSAPEIRIGDRERAATDAHLRQALDDGVLTLAEYDERTALCWQARTRADLDTLTRDLPALRPAADVATVPDEERRPWSRHLGGTVGTVLLIGGLYLGSQVLGADDGVSVFGNRTVTVSPGSDRVEVGMLFGSTEVVVPDGVRVRTEGAVLFGSTNCESACRASGPEVVVDVNGAFGSVNIVTAAER
ncbi:DUF1707 domain-containing protein [Mycobacterium sp. PS03-16]|uniref:DUF1707 SHOCT-like domain-containing protein n=1 Tax=Mycobacterium sp. PS03-16 TaxID=2559611 RepID=UPI0010746E82|nr:DUF1707 domain-containing protein [Mycobacterium sp. PS03-16]TFV56414.1 DUF1707 domain-containing protein [Mycobacterium sp. PS03-16]